MSKESKLNLEEEEEEEKEASATEPEEEEEEEATADTEEDPEDDKGTPAAEAEEEDEEEEEEKPAAKALPAPKTEAGLVARIRTALFGARASGEVDVLSEIDRLKAENAKLQQKATRSLETAVREREGRAKAEAGVLMKDHGGKFNKTAAKMFTPWLEKACAEGKVELSKGDLSDFLATLPNLAAVFGASAGKLPPASTSAAEKEAGLGGDPDAIRDAKIKAIQKQRGVSYAEAFEIVRKAKYDAA